MRLAVKPVAVLAAITAMSFLVACGGGKQMKLVVERETVIHDPVIQSVSVDGSSRVDTRAQGQSVSVRMVGDQGLDATFDVRMFKLQLNELHYLRIVSLNTVNAFSGCDDAFPTGRDELAEAQIVFTRQRIHFQPLFKIQRAWCAMDSSQSCHGGRVNNCWVQSRAL